MKPTDSISPDFFTTAAQVIVVLLLAEVVRVAWVARVTSEPETDSDRRRAVSSKVVTTLSILAECFGLFYCLIALADPERFANALAMFLVFATIGAALVAFVLHNVLDPLVTVTESGLTRGSLIGILASALVIFVLFFAAPLTLFFIEP